MVMLHEFTAAHIVRKPVKALLLLADRIDVTAEREATAVVKASRGFKEQSDVPIPSNTPTQPLSCCRSPPLALLPYLDEPAYSVAECWTSTINTVS